MSSTSADTSSAARSSPDNPAVGAAMSGQDTGGGSAIEGTVEATEVTMLI